MANKGWTEVAKRYKSYEARIAHLEKALRGCKEALNRAQDARIEIEAKVDMDLHEPLLEMEEILNKELQKRDDK